MGNTNMPLDQSMKDAVQAIPENKVFKMEDITGEGSHSPDLWMLLCSMDNGKVVRNDGCTFFANTTRIRFVWSKDRDGARIAFRSVKNNE